MPGIVAAFDALARAPLGGVLDDLSAPFDRPAWTWADAHGTVRLGAVAGRGAPPSGAEDGECAAVLDGFVYAIDGRPTGEGGAEIVLEGYRRWGDSFARRLDGEFAFVVWDGARRRLVAGCDVTGRRTLAFHSSGSFFLASTRAVALLRDARVPRTVDGVYVAQALGDLWAHVPGRTVFSHIRRLRPGFGVVVEGDRVVERQVDRLDVGPPRRADLRSLTDAFWSLLDGATERRVRADAPPCVLLSGGLDSSCVLASVTAQRGAVRAFSVVDPRGDERSAIDAVVGHLAHPGALEWRPVPLPADPSFLPEVTGDLPLADDPVIAGAGYLPARMAAWTALAEAGVARAFDGEGGDEIFTMAMSFDDLLRGRAWGEIAHGVWNAPVPSLWRGLLQPRLPHPVRSAWRGWRRRRRDPLPPWLGARFRASRELRSAFVQADAWWGRVGFGVRLPALLENPPAVGTTQAARLFASSRGVTPSSPLFDRKVAEFASRIDARFRFRAGETKRFLRLAAAARLPEAVCRRPKDEPTHDRLLWSALRSPRAACLAGAVGTVGWPSDWVDRSALEGALAGARAGVPMNARRQEQLYALLALVGWWQRVEAAFGSLRWDA
jgi:asparagine synthase (glutamine-hydrolysing)